MQRSMFVAISLLVIATLACTSGGNANSSDQLAETLMAESANVDATGTALRPTYEAELTQGALPTATMPRF